MKVHERRFLGVAACLVAALVIAAGALAADGDLTPQDCVQDNDSGTDACAQSADGLDSATSVAVSADGTSVYVSSTLDDAIVRFDRNTSTGALTPAGCIDDDDTGADACAASTDGLAKPHAVAVSADGKSVYAASDTDDAIVRFDRNTSTGALTPAGCIDDDDSGADACAASTDGLDQAAGVVVSADGKSVYVTGREDDSIVRFDRDTSTGALTAAGCVDDNDSGADACAASADGLDGAVAVAISAEGESVYVASQNDDAVVRFDRDTSTGALTDAGCVDDNDGGGQGEDACAQSTDGLASAGTASGSALVVSSDGKSVYTAGGADDAIVRLSRNTTTGALTPGDCVDDNDTGADTCAQSTDGLDGAGVTMSLDGKSVYGSGSNDDAVVRLDRNLATGALTPAGCVDDNDTGADTCAQSTDGLAGANTMAVSVDNNSLYVTGHADDAVVRIDRDLAGFPRPAGATPLRASLVVAYDACTASNATHGGGLTYSSCRPPVQSSPYLTVGTPDANGAAAKMSGAIRLDVCPNSGCTPPDVQIKTTISDVRCKATASPCGPANTLDGPDYTGELQGRFTLRITDKDNTVSPPAGPGTTVDSVFSYTVTCTATAGDATKGSDCDLTTTANTLVPSAFSTGKRANVRLDQVEVADGGSDGDVATSGTGLFLYQGFFVP